jgi:hypothetical protein
MKRELMDCNITRN